MTKRGDDELDVAALRYRMIADAAEGTRSSITEAIRKAAAAEYHDAQGQPLQRSARQMWRYLHDYRKGRIEALLPKPRTDRGELRALSREILDRAIELRRERADEADPLRATDTIIDILVREKRVKKDEISRSTLDRHFLREGVSRRQLGGLGKEVYRKILTEAPFDLVLVDFHHGPYVRVPPRDELRRALLCAFIDHYSRFVPEARYYLHEDFVALRFGFRRLLTTYGLMTKLYRDRGAAFQALRFRVACERIGINLVASKAYRPEGRGCNERFNGTVKDQFESEVRRREEPLTLDELNAYFAAWLAERYHRDTHSETGETPLERFERDAVIRPAPDLADIDEVLRIREERSVHKKWSTIEARGVRFLVSGGLRGRKVHVLYDPSDLAYVLVEVAGNVVQRAYPQKPGEVPPQVIAPATSAKRTDYLQLLRADHEARNHAELQTLRLRSEKATAELTLIDLLALVQRWRGKTLSPDEHAAVAAFFRKMRPLDPKLIETATQAVQRRLGPALHVSAYLDELQAVLVRQRTTGGKKR